MGRRLKKGWQGMALMALVLIMLPASARAFINGISGTGTTVTFNITAKDGRITMGDGTTAYIWGYAAHDANMPWCPSDGCAQYAGPTLIVTQGQNVVVNLKNNIPTLPGNTAVNTSMVFPGQNVTASGGVPGFLTQEATPGGGTVKYTFTATNPGTYTYYSGTQPELQTEMGLIGALIVRPNNVGGANCPKVTNAAAPNNGYAYCVRNAYYDHEYLFLVTEMDPVIHRLIEFGNMAQVDNTSRHSTAWFVNGRNFPDTVSEAYAGWLPSQPYNALPLEHPLESVLARFIGGGRELHPYHTHGQNHAVIARDGRLLQSPLASGYADMPISDYTTTTVSGETVDAIWGPWSNFKLNWDIYGPLGNCSVTLFKTCLISADCPASEQCLGAHVCDPSATGPLTSLIAFLGYNGPQWAPGFDPNSGEWCGDHPKNGNDHSKDIPVAVPDPNRLSFGPFWGGTPYLGIPGELPPIPDPHTGDFRSNQNPLGGIQFMWHSHSEREITTNNIFIGGMATMDLVLPYKDAGGNPINIP